jgi:hypothetical protein
VDESLHDRHRAGLDKNRCLTRAVRTGRAASTVAAAFVIDWSRVKLLDAARGKALRLGTDCHETGTSWP